MFSRMTSLEEEIALIRGALLDAPVLVNLEEHMYHRLLFRDLRARQHLLRTFTGPGEDFLDPRVDAETFLDSLALDPQTIRTTFIPRDLEDSTEVTATVAKRPRLDEKEGGDLEGFLRELDQGFQTRKRTTSLRVHVDETDLGKSEDLSEVTENFEGLEERMLPREGMGELSPFSGFQAFTRSTDRHFWDTFEQRGFRINRDTSQAREDSQWITVHLDFFRELCSYTIREREREAGLYESRILNWKEKGEDLAWSHFSTRIQRKREEKSPIAFVFPAFDLPPTLSNEEPLPFTFQRKPYIKAAFEAHLDKLKGFEEVLVEFGNLNLDD